jgi:hypothetical protein
MKFFIFFALAFVFFYQRDEDSYVAQVRAIVADANKFDKSDASIYTLIRLSNVVWKRKPDLGQEIALLAQERILSEKRDDKYKERNLSELISVVAKHDPVLAKKLVDDNQKSGLAEKVRSQAFLSAASSLVKDNPNEAIKLVDDGFGDVGASAILPLLHSLREQQPKKADLLFFRALESFSHRPEPDIENLMWLGSYVFSSLPPESSEDKYTVISNGVGPIAVINLAFDRPEASAEAILAYLQAASQVLTRPVTGKRQQMMSVAVGGQLLPRLRRHLPDAAIQVEEARRRVMQDVPASLYDQKQYDKLRSVNTPDLRAESARLDKPASDLEKDTLCLILFEVAAGQKDYELMEKIAGKARSEDLQSSLKRLTIFYNLERKINAGEPVSPGEIKSKLSSGIERAAALLLCGEAAAKRKDMQMCIQASQMAVEACEYCSDEMQASVLMLAMEPLDCEEAGRMLGRLVEVANKAEKLDYPVSLRLDGGAAVRRFRFSKPASLTEAIRGLISCDTQRVIDLLPEVKNEMVKGKMMIAIAQNLTKKEKTGK